MVKVSVLIVTWNSADVIKGCIDSVIKNSGEQDIELVIVDNNSDDNTFSILNNINYPKLQVYKNSENSGFTKAVNRAISLSGGRNILLLNPDTLLNDNCIRILCDFLDKNPGYGACAPLMINEDGTVQHSIRSFPTYPKMFIEFMLLSSLFPNSKLFGKWKMKYMDYSRDTDVEQPMAAAFMYKKDLIDKLDERFEMFFSDVDVCKRIIDSGEKIRLLTSASVIHKHGESIYKERERMIKVWNRDCYKYFQKYYPNPILLAWLKINLKVSEIIRILAYKIST